MIAKNLKINSRVKQSRYVVNLKQAKIAEPKQKIKKPNQTLGRFLVFWRKILSFIPAILFRISKILVKTALLPRKISNQLFFSAKQKSSQRKNRKKRIAKKRKFLIQIINQSLYTLGEAIVHIPVLLYLPIKMFFKGWLSLGDRLGSLRRFKPAPAGFWVKEIGVFLLISLILILPVSGLLFYKNLANKKGQVLGAAAQAINSARLAANNLAQDDFFQAEENFKNVSNNLVAAENTINNAGIFVQLLAKIAPQGRTAEDLIAVGYNLSQASILITQGLKEIQTENAGNSITWKINILKDKFQTASHYLESANGLIKNINPRQAPAEYRQQLTVLQDFLPQIEQGVGQAVELFDNLLILLGHNSWQRYLLLLQNTSELRPAGGFVGTLAVIDIDQGQIKNLNIPGGGAYDFRAGFGEKALSPQPLSVVNPAWEMQDCNWFVDFPSSAEKCQWFLEKSGGPSVDGVIAINSDFFVDLLKILGPIEIDSVSSLNNQDSIVRSDNTFNLPQDANQVVSKSDTVVITAENFMELAQNIVESDSARASGQPKAFLAELAPIVLEKIFKLFDHQSEEANTSLSWPSILSLGKLLQDSLNKKSVQIYAKDKKLENWLKSMSWAGAIKSSQVDYLSINVANVGGGKSDMLVRQKVTHEVEIEADGSAVASVTIRREHLGVILTKEDELSLLPYERLINSRNIAYVRVYAPAGSELISATGGFYLPIKQTFKTAPDGFKTDEYLNQIEQIIGRDYASGTVISQEYGKTVFGNYIVLEPGEFRSATFKYRLPFKLIAESDSIIYSLLIQKQAGANQQEFVSRLKLPARYQIIESSASASGGVLSIDNNISEYQSRLEAGDEFYGIIFSY